MNYKRKHQQKQCQTALRKHVSLYHDSNKIMLFKYKTMLESIGKFSLGADDG